MKKRNLLTNPCWSSQDLGEPLPNSPHAVSVALPQWKDVIAYEEKDQSCIDKLKAIYPRFGFNPLVAEISKIALLKNHSNAYNAWPFPNISSAIEAQKYCQKENKNSEAFIQECKGLQCLITDSLATPNAKAFWQHTGLGASSRQAAIALGKEEAPQYKEGEEAKRRIINRLAKIYSCSEDLIGLYPSGMAALNGALIATSTIKPNQPTLQLGFPYVDVLKLPQVIFSGSDLLVETEYENVIKVIEEKKPSAVIIEVPSNPLLKCIDLISISKLAHEREIIVIVDDTIGSAINIDCLQYADIVFSSLTKSFAGSGDILAGSLTINPDSKWKEELKKITQEKKLADLSNPDAIALEESSRDVIERVHKLNIACITFKHRLENHECVAKVFHPEQCKNFKSLMRPDAGYGCLLSFELIGGLEKTKKFYNELQTCKGPSLGTNFTLVCPYVLLAHYQELDWAKQYGVASHLIRVSIGLENADELWDRFENALSS